MQKTTVVGGTVPVTLLRIVTPKAANVIPARPAAPTARAMRPVPEASNPAVEI